MSARPTTRIRGLACGAGEPGADLRKLTPGETDALIRPELWLSLPIDAPEAEHERRQAARGIDSEPPVRRLRSWELGADGLDVAPWPQLAPMAPIAWPSHLDFYRSARLDPAVPIEDTIGAI